MSMEVFIKFWGKIRMNFLAYLSLNTDTFISFNIVILVLVSHIIFNASSISYVEVFAGLG